MTVPTGPEARCEILVSKFEGKEAIYVENGIARVRVFHIVPDLSNQFIEASVEIIPTAGLPLGFMRSLAQPQWKIGSGPLTEFSESFWAVGYGMWQMYFDTSLIESVVRIADSFPETMECRDRYNMVIRHINDLGSTLQDSELVFLDMENS